MKPCSRSGVAPGHRQPARPEFLLQDENIESPTAEPYKSAVFQRLSLRQIIVFFYPTFSHYDACVFVHVRMDDSPAADEICLRAQSNMKVTEYVNEAFLSDLSRKIITKICSCNIFRNHFFLNCGTEHERE